MFAAYLPVAKLATQFVTGLGVSRIVSSIVRNNVVVVTTAEKVVVNVSSFVLASMIVEQTSNHIERVTNQIVSTLQEKEHFDDSEK